MLPALEALFFESLISSAFSLLATDLGLKAGDLECRDEAGEYWFSKDSAALVCLLDLLLEEEDLPFFLRPGLDLILVDFKTANIVFVEGVVALLVKGTLIISLTAALVVTFGADGADGAKDAEDAKDADEEADVDVEVAVEDDFFDFFFFQNLSTFKVLYFDEKIALTPVLSKATKSKFLLLVISDFVVLVVSSSVSSSVTVLVGTDRLGSLCLTTNLGSEGSEDISSSTSSCSSRTGSDKVSL